MRKLARYPLVAALTLAGFFHSPLTAAPAAASTVDGTGRSAHFDAVNKHLELGGVLYGYMDIDGDVAKLGSVLSDAVGKAAEINPMLAMARSSLASALVALRSYDEAESLLRDSYPIVIGTQGKNSAVVRQVRAAQAEIDASRCRGRPCP